MRLMVKLQKIRHLLRSRPLSVYTEEDEGLLSGPTKAPEEF